MIDKEFIDLEYKPENDIICTFKIEPSNGLSIEEVAAKVASESSVGTWTDLTRIPERVQRIKARVFYINGNIVKIAYPLDLFEEGNIPQLLSSIAGNIFGMKAVKNLRLEDVEFPLEYLKCFKGAKFGIDGIRKRLNIKNRPLLATVPKPKVGFDADEFAEVAYESLLGGVDLIKDDENLTNLKFIRFEERLNKVMKTIEKVEKETGEKKSYLVNITSETKEMLRRAKAVADYGNEYVMIDVLTAGFSALQALRNECEDLNLAIHAHRAMHAAFTRNEKHGIALRVMTKLVRIVGVDNIHVGTGVGKMVGEVEEVKELADICRKEWHHLKPIFPVSSGGLHPGLVPSIIEFFGIDVIIQAGGGIHGHPDGTYAGAKAMREAVELTLKGESLENGGKELKRALEKWG